MYGKLFYQTRRRWTKKAAAATLPLILDLLKPNSIVDVGCGTGIWLAEAKRMGVSKVLGLDGPWVSENLLEISDQEFRAHDFTSPESIADKFDLALSLEVGEHLPNDKAESFVQSLCDLAPVVVFSAAIPGQGGERHVNEQWQSYWIKIFQEKGYELFDVLRPTIWNQSDIPYWYRQNTLVFISSEAPNSIRRTLVEKAKTSNFHGADLVHPAHAIRALQYPGLLALVRAFPFAFVRTLSTSVNFLRSGWNQLMTSKLKLRSKAKNVKRSRGSGESEPAS